MGHRKMKRKIGSVHGRMQNRNGATRNSFGHRKTMDTEKKEKTASGHGK
jgi:hypothetical protein